MHGVAEAVTRIADREELAGRQTREQLRFLGSNNLKTNPPSGT